MRSWLKRRRMLLVLLAGYVMFTLFGGCASQLILFPSRHAEPGGGAKREMIPFGEHELEVLVARSPGAQREGPRAYYLTFTGNAGRAEWSAAPDAMDWGDKPVEVWSVQHPGFGGSTGPARLNRLAPAALAAYDALAARAQGKPIFLSGMSLGTTMALHVAANRPVAGLVLRTPPPLQNMILSRHGWWNLWLLATPVCLGVPADLNALTSAPKVTVPAVFLLMDTDSVVPLKYQQKVVNGYAGPKRVVTLKGGDHNSALSDAVHREMMEGMEWLWSLAMKK